MARKGKLPVAIPTGVDIDFGSDGITVKGPKGALLQAVHPAVDIEVIEGSVFIRTTPRHPKASAMQGLYRTLIENMVIGTTKGFEKRLTMIGVGYRAAVKGDALDLNIGLSHPTVLQIPEGIEVKVEKNVSITVSGSDKQRVGQFAANIRAQRPPEPYQGKGIRYVNEYVRKKAGKSAGK